MEENSFMEFANIEEKNTLLKEACEYLQEKTDCNYYEALIETFSNILEPDELANNELYDTQVKQNLIQYYQKIDLTSIPKQQQVLLFEYMILAGYRTQAIHVNQQMTPDAICLLVCYILEKIFAKQKQITLTDITVGTGNLLFKICERFKTYNKDLILSGIDNDDTQLTLASLGMQLHDLNINLYHQDAVDTLKLTLQDAIVGDLPVGYYPLDQRTKDFKTKATSGHSYTHHLLIEQSLRYLKPNGIALFVVPNDLFTKNEGKQLLHFINENAYLQACLQLPDDMFSNAKSQKSLLLLQKPGQLANQAQQVLLAKFPQLKAQDDFGAFVAQIESWITQNIFV